MMVLLYEYWKSEFSHEDRYMELKDTESITEIVNKFRSYNNKLKYKMYKRFRILTGNLSITDIPFEGDEC